MELRNPFGLGMVEQKTVGYLWNLIKPMSVPISRSRPSSEILVLTGRERKERKKEPFGHVLQ